MELNQQIIIVDDDCDFLEILKRKLHANGFQNIRTEDNPGKAASVFQKGGFFDIALIDMNMPGMDGVELLDIIKRRSPRTECIMVTAVNDARTAVECLKRGAYDYLVKPVSDGDLRISMQRTLERKRLLDILDIEKSTSLPELKKPELFKAIITRSKPILKVLKEAELHAGSDVPVLITGESGTGKELLARAIHLASPRKKHPFTPVNMASLTPTLFEAEFFGHTKGAFTGAESNRAGFLEHTNKGTLFLDEIGDMPLALQGKLLRIFQDGEYLKLGSSRHKNADIRFIAATNEDIEAMVAQKKFRQDLFYRVRGGWLHLPPLRERKEDIPLLINKCIRNCAGSDKNSGIHEDAVRLLMEYDFPGNIRELFAIIQSSLNLAQGSAITCTMLPEHIIKNRKPSAPKVDCLEPDDMAPLAQIEKNHILKVYRHTRRNKSKTARILGIGLNTLRRKLKSYAANGIAVDT